MNSLLALFILAPTVLPDQEIETRFQEIFENSTVPGMSACVIMPDGTELLLTHGFADENSKVKLTPKHRFAGGSSGKMHFAVWAMHLIEQGIVSLDDPISKYLGDEDWFSKLPIGEGATLKQFMNHSSGMREHVQAPTFIPAILEKPLADWKMKDALAHVFDQDPLFDPGEGWSYADSNFILLSLALEKASRKVAYEEIANLTIKPLKLTQTEPSTKLAYTLMTNGKLSSGNPFGEGWSLENGQFKMNPQFEWAGGGFITSPRDLARLTRAIVEAKVVSSASAKLMMEGIPARTGRDHRYGLGLMIRPSEMGTSYGHSGWYPGYVTDVQHFTEHGITVGFQMNTDDFRALGMSYQSVAVELAKAAVTSY